MDPIPVDEALHIAQQIADALEAAHERGIIHRDLKPANVKVRSDGTVKVLDFGLAKAMEPAAGPSSSVSQSPTITPSAMTQAGMILGTAAYMSPEQARGKTVDKRADIWAFGCVVYEMLAGRRAFAGEGISETLSSVLTTNPDWTALPSRTPAPVAHVLRRCLDKNPRDRLRDIGDARVEFEQALTGPLREYSGVRPTRTAASRWKWRGLQWAVVIGSLAVTTALVLTWQPRRSLPSTRVSRFAIVLPPTTSPTISGIDSDVAITPDGSRLVYVGGNGTQLFVRPLDALEPVTIATGDSTRGPFVSPDGQWVGFIDNSTLSLKKVAITGGPPITITRFDAGSRGATWALDDSIIFATTNSTTGLLRVSAAGGTPVVLTAPDRAGGEADHFWPEMLPDGRGVLFTITGRQTGLDAAQIAVLDLRSGTRKLLVRGGSHARYVPDGYIVYATSGTLRAVRFDLANLNIIGTPVPIGPQVVTTATGAVVAAVAGDGTLVYVPGSVGAGQRAVVWVDRRGYETPIAAPPHAYQYPRLSPDGTRLLLVSLDDEYDVWLLNLASATLTRLTFDPAQDSFPVWTPDARRLVFNSARSGAQNLFWQSADGTGPVERLTETPSVQNATSISADGTKLTFTLVSATSGPDVMMLRLDDTRRVEPLVQTQFNEANGELSPDGRWLVYQSDESGQLEIYVRPFPAVNDGRWQVSAGGGTRPLWARNSQELFYLASDGAFMRVDVARGSTWVASAPEKLLGGNYSLALSGRPYDISLDGERFLMTKVGGGSESTPASSFVVVQNWTEELKRLVPTN